MPNPFTSLMRRLWEDPPPTLAVEFSAHAVAAARWNPGASRPEQMAVRPLPANALRPSPVRENFQEPAAVAAAVSSALQEVTGGVRSARRDIAVLLPDLSARVTVLSVESLPSKPDEILALVKFRLKKAVPFDVDDAVISIQVQDGQVLAALSPREVVRQYEGVVEDLGYNPGLVTLSTLAGLSLVVPPAGAGAGAMLIRRGDIQATIAISSAGRLDMLRISEWADHDVQELFQDVYSSAIFYQDNRHGRVERIYHSGLEAQTETLLNRIETEMGVTPRLLVVPGADPEQASFLGIFGMLAAQSQTL
jgi:type IV pilus assembly protein PilM